MFAISDWDNEDAEKETATSPVSEGTSVQLPSRSQEDIKTLAQSTNDTIIRQGIKFDSYEEFCQFVDGGSKSQFSRDSKKSRQDRLGRRGSSDEKSKKKQKFNVNKLIDMLSEDKSMTTSSTTFPKLSKSEAKLRTSRFRYLNQQLYTQTGEASFKVRRLSMSIFYS